jgi:hypothetical protein
VSVLRLEALRLSGDEASALQGWKLRREAADRAGTKMPESHMRVMWALIKRLESSEQANAAMERLAQAYPRGEYFADLVATAARGAARRPRPAASCTGCCAPAATSTAHRW